MKAASKAGKLVKNGVKAAKALKNGNKLSKAAKATKAGKLRVVKPKKKLANNRYSKATNKAVKKASNGGCFVAGTKIYTKNGYKNIEAIKVGDYVWSQDPTTNEKTLKSVKKIFVREKDSIIRLSINGEVIETTHEHPFYVEGRGFIAAAELKAGDEVRLFDDEEAYIDRIEEIELTEPIKVYNFEVEDYHTYYVSEQKVLVHNTCAVGNNTTLLLISGSSNETKQIQQTINFVLGEGSSVRKVSYSNIRSHSLKKHFTGNGEYSLKKLYPNGTTDKWMSYINELATTGEGIIKKINDGELLEIMGKMPKTGGDELDMGVRLYRKNDSSKWSLRTVLTRN